MDIIPSQDDVMKMLRRTGGLRSGHFQYPSGQHTDEYLQVALTMRHFEAAKILSVGLSRLVRANTEIRAMIPELSIVAPATGGLPVAYGVGEALRAKQVYWAEKEDTNTLSFRQFMEVQKGEKVLLVDDILRTGRKLSDLKNLVESNGGEIVGVAVLIHEPVPGTPTFDPLPFFSLAKFSTTYYGDAKACQLCARGVPLDKTRH
jgi:orotate phosphoribosyltransferase